MWIQCLIEHQGPFEYDVPNGDGSFTMIPFARDSASGAQLANVTNRKHSRFLLEQRERWFRQWRGDPPADGPPMRLSYQEMMAGLRPATDETHDKGGEAEEKGRKTDASSAGVNVAELEGEALREYARSIGMTSLPPKAARDDTLRRAILDYLEMQHEADLEELTAGGEGEEGEGDESTSEQ